MRPRGYGKTPYPYMPLTARRTHERRGGKLPADRKESPQRAAQTLSRRSRDEPVRTPPEIRTTFKAIRRISSETLNAKLRSVLATLVSTPRKSPVSSPNLGGLGEIPHTCERLLRFCPVNWMFCTVAYFVQPVAQSSQACILSHRGDKPEPPKNAGVI